MKKKRIYNQLIITNKGISLYLDMIKSLCREN